VFNPDDYHICNRCSTRPCPRMGMYMQCYDIHVKGVEEISQKIAALPDDGMEPFTLVLSNLWVEQCSYFTESIDKDYQ